MSDSHRPRIVVLGAGNVASCLVPALTSSADIVQIFSRTLAHAQKLASAVKADATDTVEALMPDADFYIIAVKDDAVTPLCDSLRALPAISSHGIWMHTSGACPLSVLDGLGRGRCVFYPLQTFTSGEPIDPSSVTMLIEGDTDLTADRGRRLASSFTHRIHFADSELRRRIHLAAVFASNFANHMWSQAERILEADGLDLSLLQPLIEATLRKAIAIGPESGQTGPARRGDKAVMNAHLSMLPPSEAELYDCVSRSIMSNYNLETSI